MKNKNINYYYDLNIIITTIIFFCFGLILLFNITLCNMIIKINNNKYFSKQIIFDVLSIILSLLIAKIDYNKYFNISKYIYLISIFLMFLVKTKLGVTINGARRWLRFGIKILQFQPSEIAKISIILFVPYLIIKIGKRLQNIKFLIIILIIGSIPSIEAFILTDNLSTGIIIELITIFLIFIFYPKIKYFTIIILKLICLTIIFIIIIYICIKNNFKNIKNFRFKRIIVWLNPSKYSKTYGYQIMQSLYAIASGGFFGKGLGGSIQKFGAIPEAQNDMVFSIICEEFGLFGGIIIIILFIYFLYKLIFIANNISNLYGFMIVIGVFSHISIQIILNICVVINFIPTTGISLPFISYGGTSTIFLAIEIGIVMNIARQIN